MSDNFFINSMYLSTHIYVGCSFVFLSIFYFLITKGMQATLFSKTLGTISFWGYLFLLPWSGFKYFYGTTLPDWIENVSIYLSLSLIIPLLALIVNYSKTIATKENKGEMSEKTNKKLINVFVPTTPNPTSGFLLMFPIEDVIYLNMSFEEASKFIVSAGTSTKKN